MTASSEDSTLTKPLCSKLRTRVKTNSSTEIAGNPADDLQSNFEVVIRKIDLITTGLPEYVSKQLTDLYHLSSENALF